MTIQARSLSQGGTVAPSPALGGALIVRGMASKGIVPDSKREEALVALGKQQARAKLKQDQKDQYASDEGRHDLERGAN